MSLGWRQHPAVIIPGRLAFPDNVGAGITRDACVVANATRGIWIGDRCVGHDGGIVAEIAPTCGRAESQEMIAHGKKFILHEWIRAPVGIKSNERVIVTKPRSSR